MNILTGSLLAFLAFSSFTVNYGQGVGGHGGFGGLAGVGGGVGVAAPPTGMLIWYRGDSLTCTGGCSGTNVVTAFVDKSGNGNNASGSTGATYAASFVGGQPGVTFNNSSPSVFTIATPINLTSGGITVCVALKLYNTASKSSLFSGDSGSFDYWFANGAPSMQGSDETAVAQLIAGTSAADTSYHSMCTTYDGTTAKLWLDGSTDGTATPGDPITSNEKYVGQSNGTEYFKGTLLDLVVYNSVLPASGANSIATWFTYTTARY